jgi:hypothetical protein
MSKRTIRSAAISSAVGALLLSTITFSTVTSSAHAASTRASARQLPSQVTQVPPARIDVDPTTGLIGKGLVLASGPGNYITVTLSSSSTAPFIAVATTGGGYGAGELVVPGGGFVTVPIFSPTKVLVSKIRVWDAKTADAVLAPDVLGSAANLRAPITSRDETKPLAAWVLEVLAAPGAAANGKPSSSMRVYDYRTDPLTIKSPDVLGNARNLTQPVLINGTEKVLAIAVYDIIGYPQQAGVVAPTAPVGAPPLPTPTVTSPAPPSVPAPPVTTASVPPVAQTPQPQSPTPTAVSATPIPIAPPAPAAPVVAVTPRPGKVCVVTKIRKVRVGKKLVSRGVCLKYQKA